VSNKKSVDVSFVLPSLHGGGAEKVTLALAKGMADQGLKTELVVFRKKGAFSEAVPIQVSVIDLRSDTNLLATFRLAMHYYKSRPRVVLSALANADQAVALIAPLLRLRSFIAVHSTMSRQYANIADASILARKNRVRKLYRRVTGLIGCGKAVAVDADEFLQLPKGTVVPIYNPVVYPELLVQAEEAVNHPWYSSGVPVIISVGRLAGVKDFENLITAFNIVRQVIDCRLIILGEGEERADLENLIYSLDLEELVQLEGFCANPYAYISKSSLFVLSSRYEGLPSALIESLACGTPAVSTDCPSGPQEILEGGRYGRLVPIEDSEALALAIIDALKNPLVPPVESWKRFQADIVVKQYISLLLGED
jgi:glycosyltransferase involved in cell wall biosynthesis